MAKYNVGDVLEITEDFTLEYAEYTKGEKYAITEVEGNRDYYLESDKWNYSNTISEVDAHSGFRKVVPKVAHMELGKTYRSTDNELFYTPTEFDFEAGRASFDYASEQDSVVFKSTRPFCFIEEEFGVLPPVKPDTQEVDGVEIGGWDREEFSSAAPEPETVSVVALREAYAYVDHEYPDIEKLIKLAKRLES